MIEQTAKVIEVEQDEGFVWLEPNTQSSCQACSSQSTCGTSLIGKIFNHKDKKIRVENTCSAKIGDRVVIGMSEKVMLLSSLMIYLLPLLSLIFFAGIAVFFSSLANLDKGSQDLLILISLVISFAISYLFLKNSHFSKQSGFLSVRMLRVQ